MANPRQQGKQPRPPQPAATYTPEVVDPIWILKMVGGLLVLALLCAYLAICGLFWYGQWQLVLHPSRTEAHTAREFGLGAEDVHFGDGNALRGWWIAGDAPADAVVIMLPGGDGEATDLFDRARTLHDAHLSVLLFDYRGFGKSAGQHPVERTMQQDSEWALAYATQRSAQRVLVYGKGAGASLAVRLASEHHELQGVVLEAPDGDYAARARSDGRARLAPFDLLFDQNFPLAAPLANLQTPKLLVSYGQPTAAERAAANPKMLLSLPDANDEQDWRAGLQRFLDMYAR